jgi:tetratricopeptide (TPR) repeat protein
VLLPAGVLLGVLGAVTWAGYVWWGGEAAGPGPESQRPPVGGPPEDPRLAYAGPYRNVRPGVRYVGDAACAGCHPVIAETYHRHPMARSLLPIAAVAPSQAYGPEQKNPFHALDSRFFVDRKGDRVWHRQARLGPADQVVYEQDVEAHYAIGSGARGYSYLTSRDGYLFQTAVSWYTQKRRWDLSPGFDVMHATSRPVDGLCVFCHANRGHLRETSVNHFDPPVFSGPGIGCERCHGPGELHVREGGTRDRKTRADYTIVNPKRLEPALREAVCQQCHLEGATRVLRRGRRLYDFRPGLPLGSFWSVFVYADDSEEGGKAVNHVEQMYQSRCFRRGGAGRKLGCTSCHDPHARVGPAERVAHYRGRCLKCHRDGDCTGAAAERRARGDSCIDCHMKPYKASDVAHTAATDHRILRRPGREAGKSDPSPVGGLWPGLPVTPFDRGRAGPRDAELSRDLGIGLVALMGQGSIDPSLYNTRAVGLLEAALRRDPADVEAWQARAHTLVRAHNPRGALVAFEAALKLSPERETCLAGAAALAQELHDDDRALVYWRRAVAANPWSASYRAGLTEVLVRKRAWDEARAACRAWLRLAPEDVLARRQWIVLLVRDGNVREAQAELQRLAAVLPAERERLTAWFAGLARTQPAAP